MSDVKDKYGDEVIIHDYGHNRIAFIKTDATQYIHAISAPQYKSKGWALEYMVVSSWRHTDWEEQLDLQNPPSSLLL